MFNRKHWMSNLVASFFVIVSAWSFAQEPVDINTASAELIAENLKGIGLKRAQTIVDFREKNGAFRSLEELEVVKGIGPATLERNKEFILFE
jgi:competence protein ComEA